MDGNAIYCERECRTFSLWMSNLVYLCRAGQKVVDNIALELRRELV